jgi:putative ABC transport system ATP-binding protein
MSDQVVTLQSIERHYVLKGETVRALDGVDLAVERGEFMAIAGPSGSGKSTLLNIVGGLDLPDAGSVTVDGHDLASLSGKELAELRRDRIGFVFQAYNLIPVLSVRENVEYVMLLQNLPRAERRERALEIIADVGLADMAGRRPAELSGGQQQRVAVARAIVTEPALVLADEATANLDTATGEALLDTMAELNRKRGTTFVFSTHDLMIMERASRLVRLRDGRIDSDERR